nr:UvrD-like helicase, ATP-binding domain, P-loop containing nucleoside triphosphate hydrolase [Tanacetum cinerariifolium]
NAIESQINWKLLEETSEALNGEKGVLLNGISIATRAKATVVREVNSACDDLKLLSSVFDPSRLGVKNERTNVPVFLERLQRNRSLIDNFLNQFISESKIMRNMMSEGSKTSDALQKEHNVDETGDDHINADKSPVEVVTQDAKNNKGMGSGKRKKAKKNKVSLKNLHCIYLFRWNYIGDQMDIVYIDEVQDLKFLSTGTSGKQEKGLVYEIFQLKQNFRTHAGVLELAQSVIDIFYFYFAHSIDILEPETSLISGEAPVLLESGNDENAIVTIFGGSGSDGEIVGFGAEQVILVRDDCAKSEICEYVGKHALVLTVVECKGLEFQEKTFGCLLCVLELAQSVIDILYCYFAHSIGILEPETSLISGEAPVLLESGNDENAIVTIFGGSGSGGEIVGFGAEQVNSCIVFWKKHFFMDVLLYNFFGTSPLKDQWRVIYGYMKERDWLDEKITRSFPTFSESRHSVLCSELKQLYVAITRTRQRLWICENREELSKPMFDYWKRRGLVQIRKLDDSVRVASSPEEWRERGKKLFYESNFVMATMCFERARDTMWEKLAKASGLRASADQMRGKNPEAFVGYLRDAAGMFESIGKLESAALCYCDLGEYERAGRKLFTG